MIKTFDMSSGVYDEVEEIRISATRDEIRQPAVPALSLQLQEVQPHAIPLYQHGCPSMPQGSTAVDETTDHVLH